MAAFEPTPLRPWLTLMAAIRKAGGRREEYNRMAFCRMVCFLLALFFFLFLTRGITPNYRNSSQLTISAHVGILTLSWQAEYLQVWSNALRICLKTDLHFNWALTLPPYRNLYRSRRNNRKKLRKAYYGNLAFGARGPPCIRKGNGNGNSTIKFDATKGFPGEGWPRLRIATWNCRSLTHERYEYCRSLNYDVLALTELWRKQAKYQNATKEFIVGQAKLQQGGTQQGQPRFPNDRAAGVGILLSPRMQKKVMSFGSEGERVCWVRLRGPVCNLFVIASYLPHRGRVAPSQGDTLSDIQTVLSKVPARDCVCLLGDFNEQLEGGVKHHKGNDTTIVVVLYLHYHYSGNNWVLYLISTFFHFFFVCRYRILYCQYRIFELSTIRVVLYLADIGLISTTIGVIQFTTIVVLLYVHSYTCTTIVVLL